MKYIKTYENHNYKWNNITEKDGKIYINSYKLVNEMQNAANKTRENRKYTRGGYSIPDDVDIMLNMEEEYRNLITKLLKNKVISFDDCDFRSHFGICYNISFESGPFTFDETIDKDTFQFEWLSIKLDGSDEYYNVDEEIIVHLDIDPKIYKIGNKYNI